MGQCGSKEPALYTDILKQMVKAKGLKVSTSQVMGILVYSESLPLVPTEETPLLSHSGSEKGAAKCHNSDWHTL